MMEQRELRLLPWVGPEEKSCYLSTNDDDSHLSRLADTIEATQMSLAADLSRWAVDVLGDDDACSEELREVAGS